MNTLKKFGYVAFISAQSNVAYLGETLGRFVFLGIILFTFLRLWELTYRTMGSSQLGGLTLPEMMWYLALTESIMLSGPRVSQVVDEDVRSGAIGVYLLRPISYPIYRLCTTLGERSVRFALNLVAATGIVLLLVGPSQLPNLGWLHMLMALPLAFALDFLGTFIVGLGAFWMEDTNGVMLIYSRLVMILGGMLIPLELFPSVIQPLLRALPFSAIVYGPARIFVHPNSFELFSLLLRQTIGVAAMGLCVWVIYGVAMKRVVTNGG
jgi:ABC-2 type transport system permease protein